MGSGYSQKPDGKPARIERVTFTRPAADRIAKVVRRVELGNRDGAPLVYDRIGDSVPAGSALKLATFTGAWQTGTYKTVTLHGSTQTASVYNWTTPVASASTARYVIFGKASGTNAAVEIQLRATGQTCTMSLGSLDLTTLPGFNASAVQLLGHNDSGPCLQWYSVTTCSTATAA